MKLDRSVIERVIESLSQVQRRKQMYLLSVNVAAAFNFLTGYEQALYAIDGRILDVHQLLETNREQIYQQRGWEHTARGVWHQMREHGLSEEAIVDELFAIEIQIWQLILDNHPC